MKMHIIVLTQLAIYQKVGEDDVEMVASCQPAGELVDAQQRDPNVVRVVSRAPTKSCASMVALYLPITALLTTPGAKDYGAESANTIER